MERININNNEEKIKSTPKLYLLGLILGLIGLLIYFLLIYKTPTIQAVQFLFNNQNQIVYETYNVYLENIGENYSKQITENLDNINYKGTNRFKFVEDKDNADIVMKFGEGENIIYPKYLLPVGHMYWTENSVSSNDIKYGEYTVLLNEGSYNKYSTYLSNNYPDIKIESSSDLIKDLENEDCGCIGLIEDAQLEKQYKLLEMDEKYYLDTFNSGFKVSLVIDIQNQDINISFITNIMRVNLEVEISEFNKENIAKVNMSGVTALTRRVAQVMDVKNDYDYPAEKIASFLSDADITHTSNEISFVNGCDSYTGMRFCAPPDSIDVLKAIGIDVIELTGNHNNDYGSQYNTQTIETYREEGIEYFGGGLNSEDASKPYITNIDGTSIAFLGYNYYDAVVAGGSTALAGNNKAGANPYSESKMKEDIESIKDKVDIVIVDFQYQECYSYPSFDVIYPYCYKPIGSQSSVFRKAVDYGADIIVGTQAHQPQTYELYEDGVIFYGLGNLFFDQSMWIGTRQGIILTHYFKGGELIQTKITPTIYDSDLQVEIASEDDADLLLELLKEARASL